jgi:hypothetical protein
MTVAELIDKLRELPPGLPVRSYRPVGDDDERDADLEAVRVVDAHILAPQGPFACLDFW